MTRGVQTQLTEEALRKYVAQMEDLLRAGRAESRPDPLGSLPRSVQMSKADAVEIAEFGAALADAYLAQRETLAELLDSTDYEVIRLRRLVTAAENLNTWLENEGLWRAGDPDYNRTLVEFRAALAAVSVGSPETRETEE